MTCKYPQFQDRCLTTVSDSVNIRATASEDGELVGTLAANGIALVKEKVIHGRKSHPVTARDT